MAVCSSLASSEKRGTEGEMGVPWEADEICGCLPWGASLALGVHIWGAHPMRHRGGRVGQGAWTAGCDFGQLLPLWTLAIFLIVGQGPRSGKMISTQVPWEARLSGMGTPLES